MTLEDAIHACIGDFDAVIARQIPHDPDRAEMVGLTQMQHLVDDFGCCPIGWILRRGLPITGLAVSPIGCLPAIETGSGYTEISAGLGNVTNLRGMR
jgi:hypothetical protein